MRSTIVFLATLFAAQAGAAGVYSWVDDQGKVHYGDKPPTPQLARPVTIDPPASQPAPHPESALDRHFDEIRKRIDAAEDKRAAERAAARKEWLRQYRARKAQEQKDSELRRASHRGKVLPGMTPDQVRWAWGEPPQVDENDDASGHWEHWWYGWDRVSFKDGRVFSVSHDPAVQH